MDLVAHAADAARSTSGMVGRSRADSGMVGRSRADSGMVGRSHADSGMVGRLRADSGDGRPLRPDTMWIVTPDQWMDLIYEAHASVGEQSFLFEVPLETTEYKDGREIHYGPWEPAACSTVLTIWFDLGWVSVYMPTEHLKRWAEVPAEWMSRLGQGEHPLLNSSDARTLLTTPSLWREDRAEGWAALLMTESAPADDLNVWFRDIPIPAG